jgi:hypothetical protein
MFMTPPSRRSVRETAALAHRFAARRDGGGQGPVEREAITGYLDVEQCCRRGERSTG